MADPLDILTLDEAMQAVNLPDSRAGHEDQLSMWITSVSRRIDDVCGPVVARTVTETADGDGPIWVLRSQPVLSVTSVTESVYGTTTVLTAETPTSQGGYLLRRGVLHRRVGWGNYGWLGPAVVVYQAGRYADTASVDAKFKLAAGAVLRRLWAREASAWARGGDPFTDSGGVSGFFRAVDPMIDEFLGYEKLPPAVA